MNNSFFLAIKDPFSTTDNLPLRKKWNAVIIGIAGIFYFLSASVFASESNTRCDATDTSGTGASTPSTGQQAVASNGMGVVQRGINRLKSGIDTVYTGQITNDKSIMNRGIKIMVNALAMIDLGKAMIKKEIDMVAYVDTSIITKADNEKDATDVADNLTMMYSGMTLMTRGKHMIEEGMDSMAKDSTMGMDMLDKGVTIIEKGMTLIGTGRGHKLTDNQMIKRQF